MLSQKAQTVSTNKLAFTSLRLQIGIYKLLKVCQIGPGRPGHEPVHSSFYNDWLASRNILLFFKKTEKRHWRIGFDRPRPLLPVWPDWAIYWTLGKFLKPLATINLPKSPTFLGDFCKGAKIYHFWTTLIDIWQFFSGHTVTSSSKNYVSTNLGLVSCSLRTFCVPMYVVCNVCNVLCGPKQMRQWRQITWIKKYVSVYLSGSFPASFFIFVRLSS